MIKENIVRYGKSRKGLRKIIRETIMIDLKINELNQNIVFF